MASPFASSAFRKFTLRFTLPGTTLVTDPTTGLQVAGPGEEVEVLATLQGTASPPVRMMLGLNELEQALRGRLVKPMRMPLRLNAGATAPLTVDGVEGTFTLGPRWPGPIPAVDGALGDAIIGSWRAAAS